MRIETLAAGGTFIRDIKEGLKQISAPAFGTATAETYNQLPNQRAGWSIGHIERSRVLAEVVTGTTPPVDPAEQE